MWVDALEGSLLGGFGLRGGLSLCCSSLWQKDKTLAFELRQLRLLLGAFPRSSSIVYQFSGTFRRYLAGKMTWIDRQIYLDTVSRALRDIAAVDRPKNAGVELEANLSMTRDQYSVCFKEISKLVISYLYVPNQSQFSVKYFTPLQKFISTIIVNLGGAEPMEQIAESLNQYMGIRTILDGSGIEYKIYGKRTTAAFELAALRTIDAAGASRNGDWSKAISGYRHAGEEFLMTRFNGDGLLEYDIYRTLTKYSRITQNHDESAIWPMKRVIIFNVKIARCICALGQQEVAEYELQSENSSTWFERWKPFIPGNPQEWHGAESWDHYNSYRCGYARITLGSIQTQQRKFAAAEESLRSAISYFAECNGIDYIMHYSTTAHALLGWVRVDLGKYNDAIHDLEIAHSNYSSPHWVDISFYCDGYLEVRKRLCRLEYMLYLSYNQLGNEEKGSSWRARAEASRLKLVPDMPERMAEGGVYKSITDFGISNLFSQEEVIMDWMIF